MAYNPRRAPAIPPDKGSFPLDHEGQCKLEMAVLTACLKENQGESSKCRELSLKYLQCRMDKGLMAKENLDVLGFQEYEQQPIPQQTAPAANTSAVPKEKRGFIAGLEVKPISEKN